MFVALMGLDICGWIFVAPFWGYLFIVRNSVFRGSLFYPFLFIGRPQPGFRSRGSLSS